MAKTLSLGQAGYQLLEADPTVAGSTVTTTMRGTTISRIFDVRNTATGQTIENLGIGTDYIGTPTTGGYATGDYSATTTTTANIYDATSGLVANMGDGRDTLNLFGNADGASIVMDNLTPLNYFDPLGEQTFSSSGGADLLNAQKNFTNSSAAMGAGNDTVRVAGFADNSSFFLGTGNDSLYVAGASQNVYADGGDGSDILTFVGAQTDALAFGGEGGDSITFTGGLIGTNPALSAFEAGSAGIAGGAGNDTIIFGTTSTSENFFLSTGDGVDVVQLNGTVFNAGIWLGGDDPIATAGGRDSLSMTSGTLTGSTVQSNNTLGDTLVFGAGSSVDTTFFTMGSGADSMVFGGGFYSSGIELGLGADTLTFGTNSFVLDSTFDLGNDGDADVITFLGSSVDSTLENFGSGIVITGADESDILYIGSTQYNYVVSDDWWVSGADTLRLS